ncbi:ADP-ribosylation factor-like protein 6 [Aphelenchoides besseyi]|nr:ADP-ribosylation factor-like protein 6 [Aphelenchoides besseyi]KAI6235118.1 ADP-ribosylation factor-like protein 6 [Aphelenchoides besseyi]
MGLMQLFSNLLNGANRQAEILVLGLDNSGKSTILNQLKPPDAQSSSIVPTVGYNVERFTAANINFSAYDMSGQSKYRNLWETQYRNTNGIIFVVDSTDKLRLAVARDELWMLLDHKDLSTRKIPVLIFANKVDQKNALSSNELNLSLGLDLIRNHDWNIVQTCALTGQGLIAGIDWLADSIKTLERAAP